MLNLLTDDWCNPRAKQFNGMHDFLVRDGPDAKLKEHALMTEYLVLEENLLDDFIGVPDEVSAPQGPGRFELRAGDARPAALTSDLCHHRGVRREIIIRRLPGIVRDEAV